MITRLVSYAFSIFLIGLAAYIFTKNQRIDGPELAMILTLGASGVWMAFLCWANVPTNTPSLSNLIQLKIERAIEEENLRLSDALAERKRRVDES